MGLDQQAVCVPGNTLLHLPFGVHLSSSRTAGKIIPAVIFVVAMTVTLKLDGGVHRLLPNNIISAPGGEVCCPQIRASSLVNLIQLNGGYKTIWRLIRITDRQVPPTSEEVWQAGNTGAVYTACAAARRLDFRCASAARAVTSVQPAS